MQWQEKGAGCRRWVWIFGGRFFFFPCLVCKMPTTSCGHWGRSEGGGSAIFGVWGLFSGVGRIYGDGRISQFTYFLGGLMLFERYFSYFFEYEAQMIGCGGLLLLQ